jgi:sodium transport system permease protein
MRWSTIRLIWVRELRDQLRDRRTLFMIAGLPLLLYPVLGFAVLQFAVGFVQRPSTIAVVSPGGVKDFPPRAPAALAACLALPPAAPPGAGLPPDYLAAAAALAHHPALSYPPLVRDGRLSTSEGLSPQVQPLLRFLEGKVRLKFLGPAEAAAALEGKEVDLVLSARPHFWSDLGLPGERRSALDVHLRKGDDSSTQALSRLYLLLQRWKKNFKEAYLARQGLPPDFDEPFAVHDPHTAQAAAGGGDAMLKLMLRIFPFMLVMWSLAGALYPAVDVCAGEKERGTMETLLISPAGREEIVWGKFLTIWVFSAATALLNLLSMGLTTWLYSDKLPQGGVTPLALAWSVLLVLPLSAFFSAVCLAVGAYARSSKEGQYYLMPLFLVTMPLIFLTLAPGVQLNSFYSMVPVTGVVLLMQGLMTAPSPADAPWFYFLPVLAPVLLYSWLALRWAIDQFQREEVLFREAERLDLGLWLRRLFRQKEALPTAGQALFCFGLLLVLRWLCEGLGERLPLLARTGVVLLTFVAAPPLFMALLLTKSPRRALSLFLPGAGYVAAALLLLPAADLLNQLLVRVPGLLEMVRERQLLVAGAFNLVPPSDRSSWGGYVLLLALISAVSKEVAFRGWILNGLRQRFRPWTAILISSLLFAAFHMNVFVMAPAFVLGVVLGVLAVRSGSLLPGTLLHLGCYAILIYGAEPGASPLGLAEAGWGVGLALAAACALLAVLILWRLNWQGASLTPLQALVRLPQQLDGVAARKTEGAWQPGDLGKTRSS